MIQESVYWKNDLLRGAIELERKLEQARWHPASFAKVEKIVMMGFYGIRKLIEAKKIDDKTSKQSVSLVKYQSTGKAATRLSKWHYWELYDLKSPKRGSLPLTQLCHQFVHSYIFSCSFTEDRSFTSVLVSSDRDRNSHLYELPVQKMISLFRDVGESYPTMTTMRFNEKKNDFDVAQSFVSLGQSPRTLLLRSKRSSERAG